MQYQMFKDYDGYRISIAVKAKKIYAKVSKDDKELNTTRAGEISMPQLLKEVTSEFKEVLG